MLTINAIKKDKAANNAALRLEGKIPAVFYGPKEPSTSVVIDEVEFMKAFREAGESSIISIKEGANQHEALIHDIQWNAVTQKPVHVDFYVIEKGKKVEVAVPIEFVGESDAVLKLGGVLVKVLHEVEIKALPKDLPQHLVADISSLVDFDAQIKIKDIKIPEGVELESEPDEVIALVQAPREEKEEEAINLEDIEVAGKGKAVDDAEDGDADKKSEKKAE